LGIPFRIEICGGIASGKTTLANLLKGHAEVVLENFTATPFWEPFYETPGRYSFEAEVSFLLQHYHQIKRQRFDGSESITVCDFSYSLDRAYSAVSLEAGEFRAFEAVYQRVRADSAAPALLIQLRCSPETQMRRIEARARRVESGIKLQFLHSLNTAIDREIAIASELVPTLSIDSETNDFAHDAETKAACRQQILKKISVVESGRGEEVQDSTDG
jgi:deoxyadenosine/deoxycytidine kinase